MTLLSLMFGLVAALMGSPGGDLSSAPAPREPIRILSSSQDIDFPNGVVLRLEAEADAEITEVTLFYRLGRQKISIFGYPEYTPSTRVLANFRIKTSGVHYIPSGVDIEYYYQMRDTAGNVYQTPPYSFEYKDPAYDWQRYREGDLIVLWHDRPREQVEQVAREVSQQLVEVKELLGLEDTPPMKAVILNSVREAGRSFPLISGATRRGHVYGGFAFGELDVFVLVGMRRDGMVHEMTHLLLDEAIDSPRARVPSWLNEGLAMYFESGSGGREAIVAEALRRGRLLPLKGMVSQPGRPRDIRLFYAQSRSVVDHLMRVHGTASMAALLGALDQGKALNVALQEAYGMTLDQIEEEWKVTLASETPLAAAPDLGTVGTSAIIAGALGAALVAMVVRWLRRVSSPPSAANEG